MKAAVLYQVNAPLAVEDVELEKPREGEVLVKIVANGVCHSDRHVMTGVVQLPLPAVLGHEGAGIVEEIGPGVSRVEPGDHVVLSFAPDCGSCHFCLMGRPTLCEKGRLIFGQGVFPDGTTRLKRGGTPLHHFMGLASFAERCVVREPACIPIPKDMPLDKACLIGCGVMTGVGAAINTAKVEPGSTALVIGCGGVGLNVIQGCMLCGAATIVAVDLVDNKLEYARRFGATHTINPSRDDLLKTVRRLTGGRGADYAFEVIGLSTTMEQAYACTRQAGTTVVVGAGSRNDAMRVPVTSFLSEKILRGSAYGSCRPHRDMPMLVDLYRQNKLKLDELVSRTYPLDDVNEAIAALDGGEVARSVITM